MAPTTTTDGACRPVAGAGARGGAGLCPRMPRLDRIVNRSFRKVEKAADWLMGSAGPIFVGLAILLVSIGAWTFFLLFLPSAFPPHTPSFSLSFLPFPLALITCLGVIYTIAWFYASACRTPPGFVASFALESCRLAAAQVGDDEDDYEAAVKLIDARWNTFAREARQRSAWVDDGTISSDRMAEMRRSAAPSRVAVDEEDDDGNSDDHWPRVKMCFKCPKIPLWKALAYLPPELREVERKKRVRQGGGGGNDGGSSSQVLEHQREGGPSLRSRGTSPAQGGDDEGEADEEEKLLPTSSSSPSSTNHRSPFLHLTPHEEDSLLSPLRQSILLWLPSHQAHTLVPPPKPERTHHCSVCRTCVIKYDHHCPWLNQCVGLYNERHFLLFLGSLVLGCAIVLACGAREFIAAAKLLNRYDASPRLLVTGVPGVMVPRGFVLITYILSLVMGFALAVMGGSHALMLARGETNVEASDRSSLYEGLVKRRGGRFANVYDVGSRRGNMRNWFSVEMKEDAARRSASMSRSRRGGSAASRPTSRSRLSITWLWISALLPVRRPTTWSDGWHWPKRKGLGGVHAGIAQEEELTDDEVDRDDEEEEGNEGAEQAPPAPAPASAEGSKQPEMRGRAAAERR